MHVCTCGSRIVHVASLLWYPYSCCLSFSIVPSSISSLCTILCRLLSINFVYHFFQIFTRCVSYRFYILSCIEKTWELQWTIIFFPCSTCLSSERNWMKSLYLFPLQNALVCSLENPEVIGFKPFSSCPSAPPLKPISAIAELKGRRIPSFITAVPLSVYIATTLMAPAICNQTAQPSSSKKSTIQQHANVHPHQTNT